MGARVTDHHKYEKVMGKTSLRLFRLTQVGFGWKLSSSSKETTERRGLFPACQRLAGPLVPDDFSAAVRLSATSTCGFNGIYHGTPRKATTHSATHSRNVLPFGVCTEERFGDNICSPALYHGRHFPSNSNYNGFEATPCVRACF
jgi:hypothetical protein